MKCVSWECRIEKWRKFNFKDCSDEYYCVVFEICEMAGNIAKTGLVKLNSHFFLSKTINKNTHTISPMYKLLSIHQYVALHYQLVYYFIHFLLL